MDKQLNEDGGERVNGGITRRDFIVTAGMVAIGSALASGAAAAIASTGAKATVPGTAPPLPWPWVKLDPMEAGKRAFLNYHAKGG